MLDPNYVLMQDIQQLFVNKDTGLPLANGTVSFFVDDDRNVPKSVFQLSGAPPNYTYTPLANPVPLSLIGTPTATGNNDVAIYYYPFDEMGNQQLYYIVVNDSAGNMQLTREAWPNQFIGDSGPDEVSGSTADNMLSNPQFAAVNFNPSTGVILSPGGSGTFTYAIAPGWSLVAQTSGATQITVQQISIAGNGNYPTNPPYSLRITPGGNISSLQLIQILNFNPNIWAALTNNSGGYVATSVTLGAQMSGVTINYVPNLGTATQLLTGSNTSGIPATLMSTVQLPPPDNTSTSASGYVNIVVVLNTGGVTELTSVQVMGMASDIQNVAYQQTPVERQLDQLAHYYIPLTEYKPIPSYLIGWDFKYNPAQIFGDTVSTQATGINSSYYAWDQTILFQTLSGGLSVSRGTSGAYAGSFEVTAAGNGQFAIIQYLDKETARELLSQRMSVNIVASTSRMAGLNGVVTLYACTDPNLPNMNSNISLVGGLDVTGAPSSINGAWTQVPFGGFPNQVFTLEPPSATGLQNSEIVLSGWSMQGASPIDTANFFAIVVGFSAFVTSDIVNVSSISLCAGDLATIPAPQSRQKVLADCEQFYEISYALPTDVGVASKPINSLYATGGASINSLVGANAVTQFSLPYFGFQYRSLKRAIPSITIYNPSSGASNSVPAGIWTNASAASTTLVFNSFWATTSIGRKRAFYTASSNPSLNIGSSSTFGGTSYINYHYVADARFGIVN